MLQFRPLGPLFNTKNMAMELSSLGLDSLWYGETFHGMKLAGIILISVGFIVVMFPCNWPDGIYKLIR